MRDDEDEVTAPTENLGGLTPTHTNRHTHPRTCQQLGVLLMDQVGEISSIIQDHVEGLAVLEVQGLFDAPHVLLIGLTFPRIHYAQRGDNQAYRSLLGEREERTECWW